jgi:4-amino-4-deoxy-L-arabinose transferase-like glycosyltransferase
MFNDQMAGQASWLLPAALLALVGGLWLVRGSPRSDRTRAALLLWGGWLLTGAALFSVSQGIIHSYYTVLLAPSIAVLVAIGGRLLWQRRAAAGARPVLAAVVALTGGWSYLLLDRTPAWHPWLRPVVLAATVLAVAALAAWPILRGARRAARVAVLGAAAVGCLGGPAAYAGSTIYQTHIGANVAAGPLVAADHPVTIRPGGPGDGDTISPVLAAALRSHATSYRWVAATLGSTAAAGYELATREPVMAIGGYEGVGNQPTLAAFIRYVRAGAIHYYIDLSPAQAGTTPDPHGTGRIAAWVRRHFTSRRVGGVPLYTLSATGAGAS